MHTQYIEIMSCIAWYHTDHEEKQGEFINRQSNSYEGGNMGNKDEWKRMNCIRFSDFIVMTAESGKDMNRMLQMMKEMLKNGKWK